MFDKVKIRCKSSPPGNRYSDYDSIQTFNASGAADFTDLLDSFEDSYSTLEQDAGHILTQNLQDRSARTGLSLSAWNPSQSAERQAAEWWEFDWEYADSPVRNRRLTTTKQRLRFIILHV